MLFFNLKGMAFGFLAAIPVIGIVTTQPETSPTLQNVLFATTLAAIDLGYRFLFARQGAADGPLLRRDVSEWWLTTNRGGSLMLMPAWLFAGVFLLVLYVIF